MLLLVDPVLTGVDSVDVIEKISYFIVRALMTHVACVDCVDATDKERQGMRQGMSLSLIHI